MVNTKARNAHVISQQTLYPHQHIESSLLASSIGLNNFITGIAQLSNANETGFSGLKGNNSTSWQNLNFSVDVVPENSDVIVTSAVASIALMGISNNHGANNMNYWFKELKTATNDKQVVVNAEVMIGDSDGWLGQLGYTIIVAYG